MCATALEPCAVPRARLESPDITARAQWHTNPSGKGRRITCDLVQSCTNCDDEGDCGDNL